MRELEITLVVGCPNKCVYCPQSTLLKAYNGIRVMPFEDYKACLEKVPSSVKIHFSGFGEPCVHPDIVKITKYTLNKGHKLMFFTTLVGISISDLKELEGLDYDAFVVHLINEQEQASPLNAAYFEKLNFVANGNFSNLVFLTSKLNSNKSLNVVKSCQHQELVKIDRGGLLPNLSSSIYKDGNIWCRRTDQNVLLPNGDIVVCCNDYGLKYKFGNLLKQSVKEIDNSLVKEQFLFNMENKEIKMCNNCEFARLSFFGCKKVFPLRNAFSQFMTWLKSDTK